MSKEMNDFIQKLYGPSYLEHGFVMDDDELEHAKIVEALKGAAKSVVDKLKGNRTPRTKTLTVGIGQTFSSTEAAEKAVKARVNNDFSKNPTTKSITYNTKVQVGTVYSGTKKVGGTVQSLSITYIFDDQSKKPRFSSESRR